jgi:hypothetical protein
MSKLTAIAATLLASTVSLGVVANSASAGTLVPQVEGEINVGVGSAIGGGTYISTSGISITSLVDASTGTKSRLFVDKAGTANNYGSLIKFLANDVGTSELTNQYWFRPVAMLADGVTPRVENGQLEVGTYKIDFDNIISSLSVSVRWFDTEDIGTSFSAYDALGNLISSGDITPGVNSNIQDRTFANVKSLILNLGQANSPKFGSTGDGVLFQMTASQSVPEPGLILGLGTAALAGVASKRKRDKATTQG